LALLLAACADSSRPSAEQNEQLNNAAEMLNSAPGALADIEENALGEPADNSSGQD